MSILIKDMEIPEKQVYVILNPNGLVEVLDANNVLLEEYQAIHVPPHGRLGDLDELYASLKKWLIKNRSSMTEATRVWIRGVLEGIAAAPTVIEAEEGE